MYIVKFYILYIIYIIYITSSLYTIQCAVTCIFHRLPYRTLALVFGIYGMYHHPYIDSTTVLMGLQRNMELR